MAHWFKRKYRQTRPELSVAPLQITRPKVNLFYVYNLIAHRRIRYSRAFALLIACSIFLSVTVSFLITAIISKNVEVLTAKVHLSKIPFHGIIIFNDEQELDSFSKRARFPGELTRVQYAEIESNIGKLALLGVGDDLPQNTIELLFPLEISDSKTSSISAWAKTDPAVKFEWQHIILPESNNVDPALNGWALVNPASLNKFKQKQIGLVLEMAQGYRFDSMNPIASPSASRYLTEIENKAPKEARVITPYSGTISLRASAKGAYSSWQLISLIVLLSAAAAITCILTVSFLGRKRSLGIFRVLGGTVTDLRRTMAFEAAYIGLPGIVLGIFVGHNLSKMLEIGATPPVSAYAFAAVTGVLTLTTGIWMPLQLIKNANCDQLLNNRPVYVISNPSCANCGLCGGI